MGDAIANWILANMPWLVEHLGNVNEVEAVIVALAATVIVTYLMSLISGAIQWLKNPRHRRKLVRYKPNNVAFLMRHIDDPEDYQDWMDYERWRDE